VRETENGDVEMKHARILVVEDDSVISNLLEVMLGYYGYTVTGIVGSGEEAVSAVKEAPPDLVLMDISLGGEIDGIEAAKTIYTEYHTPVVFLTGRVDSDTVMRAKVANPCGYLMKPFTNRELCSTIESALNA
jgi:CheY-like chemotaxis protein